MEVSRVHSLDAVIDHTKQGGFRGTQKCVCAHLHMFRYSSIVEHDVLTLCVCGVCVHERVHMYNGVHTNGMWRPEVDTKDLLVTLHLVF